MRDDTKLVFVLSKHQKEVRKEAKTEIDKHPDVQTKSYLHYILVL